MKKKSAAIFMAIVMIISMVPFSAVWAVNTNENINLALNKPSAASSEEADSVTAAINNIGTVTPESEQKISEIRKLYEALPPEQQRLIYNYSVLTDAEAKIQELKNDAAAAKAVDDAIDAIGTVTLESGPAIEAAANAYDALTENGRAHVTKLHILEKAYDEYLYLTENNTPLSTGKCGDNVTYEIYKNRIKISGTGAIYDYTYETSPLSRLNLTDAKPYSVEFEDGITHIGNYLLAGLAYVMTIKLPADLESIGESSFRYLESLKTAELPTELKTIGNDAFAECTTLKRIDLPASVTSIGAEAFFGCINLTEFNIPENNSVEYLGDGAIYNTGIEKFNFPENITEGCISCFMGNYALKEFNFSSGSKLKNIGFGYLGLCPVIEKISLPDSVKNIDQYAFTESHNLKEIRIPNPECTIFDEAETIPETTVIYGHKGSPAEAYALKYGRTFVAADINLTPVLYEAKAPSASEHGSIRYYKDEASGRFFLDSLCLEEITEAETIVHYTETVKGKAPTCTEKGLSDGLKCTVCGEFTESQKELPPAHTPTKWIVEKEPTPEETGIRHSVCAVCGANFSETIPAARIEEKGIMGDTVRYELYSNGHLYINGTGKVSLFPRGHNLFNPLFYRDERIKTITFSEGITEIGDRTFYNIPNLTEVNLPASIENTGLYVFAVCHSLKKINFTESEQPTKLNAFAAFALSDCGFETFIFPDTMKYASLSLFALSDDLRSVILPETIEETCEEAFSNCHSLKHIAILNPMCDIWDAPDTISEQAKIYGYKGSTAESYAAKYNRTFIPIENGKFYPEEVPAKPASETEHGNIKYYECAVTGKLFSDIECKNEITIEDTIVHNNSYIINKSAPTCTAAGLTEGCRCTVCGKITVSQEVIPATGHTFGEWTVCVPATCTEAGSEKRVCSVCGAEETREIPAAGHTEEIIPAVAPTCTETGLTEGKKCSVCGEITVAQTAVEALGHKDADKDGKCDVCGEQLTEPEVKPDCKHMCHSENRFIQFIWKIVNFFNKLFKINQFCECGARHW